MLERETRKKNKNTQLPTKRLRVASSPSAVELGRNSLMSDSCSKAAAASSPILLSPRAQVGVDPLMVFGFQPLLYWETNFEEGNWRLETVFGEFSLGRNACVVLL